MKHTIVEKLKTLFENRKLKVDALTLIFAIGSWIGVFAIYAQLPVLVAVAPEGWNLPSYIVVIIKIGNIGPLIYTLMQKYSSRKMNDAYLIYGLYIIGCITAILMAFFYDRTMTIGDEEHSIGIFILTFGFAFVGSTSAVLCMPYMGRFRGIYLVTYLFGEGLSGFIPSLIALGQGTSGFTECIPKNNNTIDVATVDVEYIQYSNPPRFGSEIFFCIIFVIQTIGLIAFVLLQNLKVCKMEYVVDIQQTNGNDYKYDNDEFASSTITSNGNGNENVRSNRKTITKYNYIVLMIIMGVVCSGTFGIFPATQSFSCLPYGNTAYHLSATLSIMASPVACFIGMFLNHTSIRNIMKLTGITAIITCYVMATALLSPEPPLAGTTAGAILIVSSWTLLFGIIGYIRLSIIAIFRQQAGKSLVHAGIAQQIGSASGAVIIFLLVNFVEHLFTSYEPCSSYDPHNS